MNLRLTAVNVYKVLGQAISFFPPSTILISGHTSYTYWAPKWVPAGYSCSLLLRILILSSSIQCLWKQSGTYLDFRFSQCFVYAKGVGVRCYFGLLSTCHESTSVCDLQKNCIGVKLWNLIMSISYCHNFFNNSNTYEHFNFMKEIDA